MTNETRRQIQWAEHDARWTPPQRHTGPWNVDQTRKGTRLVWGYKREFSRGYQNEETRVDLRWTR